MQVFVCFFFSSPPKHLMKHSFFQVVRLSGEMKRRPGIKQLTEREKKRRNKPLTRIKCIFGGEVGAGNVL